MKKYFEVEYLPEAEKFIEVQDEKVRKKILYTISLATLTKSSDLFAKLSGDIWEFRTLYEKNYYRLFAFWDKAKAAYVICTHGIIKKSKKTPSKEIKKAEGIRKKYFENLI
ncbi:MAG TPA: type II toxin-antitoxin system RelE/ParE family toxin [Bacteroidales bacterium]|nr:type II toxin-antitoxin system RelE/ParE family toxin [Bacteroidales bacterium]